MIPSLTLSGAALASRSVLTSRSGFVASLASVVLPVLIALLTSTALPALATPASSHMRERSCLQSTRATESQSTHAPDTADIVPNATSPTASSDAGVPTGGTGIVPERSPAQSETEELRSSGTASTGGTGTTLDEAGEGSTSNTTGTGSMGSGSGSGPGSGVSSSSGANSGSSSGSTTGSHPHDQTQTPTETQHSTSTKPTPQQSKQKEKQR